MYSTHTRIHGFIVCLRCLYVCVCVLVLMCLVRFVVEVLLRIRRFVQASKQAHAESLTRYMLC